MTYSDIPGWFDYEALFDKAVEDAPSGSRWSLFVEVGCYLGRSTAYLARKIKESGKNIRLFAVDHGFGSPGGEDYHLHEPVLEENGGNFAGKFVSNLRDCGVLDVVTPIITTSQQAANLFTPLSLQFVFIDAAHDPESVRKDLETWWPLVGNGGTLAGHDYDGCWLGVVDAVNQFFDIPRPAPGEPLPFTLRDKDSESCWSVRK